MEFFFGVPFESLVLIVFETYRSAYQPHSYWVLVVLSWPLRALGGLGGRGLRLRSFHYGVLFLVVLS